MGVSEEAPVLPTGWLCPWGKRRLLDLLLIWAAVCLLMVMMVGVVFLGSFFQFFLL